MGTSRGGSSEPSSISSTLLEQIRAKRPEAWRRLVDLYAPVVYRWCRQVGVTDADAADVVQEVFGAVAAHLQQFRRDRPEDSFGAWLRTITQNKVRDHFRRGRHEPAAEGGTDACRRIRELSESQQDASSLASCWGTDKQFLLRVLEAVRMDFENSTWEAFWRVVVEGQSPADVAQGMGLGIHAVYTAKSRVLKRLRQELGDSPDHPS